MTVPSNDKKLLGGGDGAGASPWAIAAKNARIKGLDSVINAVILLSAWSAGNAWMYMASRSLYWMAVFGTAPKIFKRCTRSGIPYTALAFSAVFSLLSFMNVSKSSATVFNWFVNLINCNGFVSWICICAIYLRFRKATFAQNIVGDLPYRSVLQPYASYVCIFMFTLLMLLGGFTSFLAGNWNTSTFITSYFGIVFFLVLYLGHKIIAARTSPWLIPPNVVDLHSDVQEILETEEPRQDTPYKWYTKWRLLFD